MKNISYPTPEIAAGLTRLLDHVNKLMAADWERRGYTYAKAPTVDIESIGDSYARLIRIENRLDGTSRPDGVYCFVAMKDNNTKAVGPVKEGDILKAASYKAPAKHPRGNMYTNLTGLTSYGAEYLR